MSLLLLFTGGAAPSGISGTIATTNANDTASASGIVSTSGTIATTNANDTASASGTISTSGTIAATNANDTATASGDSGTPAPTGGGAARPRMRYERQPLPTIEDELEEIAMALLLLL